MTHLLHLLRAVVDHGPLLLVPLVTYWGVTKAEQARHVIERARTIARDAEQREADRG